MNRDLTDAKAREAIRQALDETLVVEAAAGTGKTTALVSRIVEIVKTGRGELAGIVAVTFTEKAAGELKLRLRGALEDGRASSQDDAVITRLEQGLSQLEEAHVGTIHGFCSDLLKQRPLQAGVDPLFEVATDEETERLYHRVFERWLETTLADPPPGIRRLLRRQAVREQGPIDELYRAGRSLLDVRDFRANWQIRPIDRESAIDELAERIISLSDKASHPFNPRDNFYLDLADVLAFVQDLRSQEQVSGKRDYDALEHRLAILGFGWRKGRGPYGEDVRREDLLAERDALRTAQAEFRKKSGADLAAHLQNELRELVRQYETVKEKRGRLDFLDLLVRARDLLRDDRDVRAELARSFTHIFVDEFQDTDPLQAEILLLLSADGSEEDDWRRIRPIPGKLFVVADPKQSIYRFRRADVALYQRVKRQLIAAGAKPVYLTTSFRSVPDIQELVNVAMAGAMKPIADNHQADYVPLDAYRESMANRQPAIVAIPIPRPYGDWGRITQYAIKRSEPAAVASWIRWLIDDSGWLVSDRATREPRPVGSSDVCLLFRRFVSGQQLVTQPYVDALQALDIPHVLVGGRGFHQREEIEAMRVALTALERPDDELSVFATLRGPLFSLSDESLFSYRTRHGALHPFRKTSSESLQGDDRDVEQALELIAKLHQGRNHRPIALTVRELLDSTRAQAGFALWQAGDQVLANVLGLVQIARGFEESGGLSFRGFVDYLDELAESPNRHEQPIAEDGVEGVRLMTVHKAKGLEFSVVILCDITCSFSMGATRHVDPDRSLFAIRLAGSSPWELLDHEPQESERDAAESLRLLYVAATRARDVLAVPVVADEPQAKGWVGPLLSAFYPPHKQYRFPIVAPKCPRFQGEDTVIDRPSRAPILPGQGIRPGLHRAEQGRHEVVWWDPSLFELETTPKPGVRRHWILQERAEGEPGEGAREYARWLEQRDSLVGRGSEPNMTVATVTRLVEEEKTAGVEGASGVEILEVEGRDPQRPAGKRFGSLVHELLARAPFETDASELGAFARSLGRVLGNTEEEILAAIAVVVRALEHDVFTRATKAELCYREMPLMHRENKGAVVEGVADLVFRESGATHWTIVDFKTDLRIDMTAESYRRQVALYARAVEAATLAPAKGVLLYV
ncbi:MAG TPA: UvrD-helicase domain-containing protein [Vicinamibacteria bacterium]|nr:UvrD-helicase domain-containing protein [Vicinamibacteria bacterium]